MAIAKGVPIEEAVLRTKRGEDVGQLSQWTLMWRRFLENRLSVVGAILIVVMYVIAALAPFLSPNDYTGLDSNSQLSPPTSLYFLGGQPVICALEQVLDQESFTFVYKPDCTRVYPIRFFSRGWTYSAFGFGESDLHLFTVDAPGKIYLFGADSLGRDIFSRVLEGSRISLTIGLVGVALSVVIGSILGTTSGYLGGVADNVIQRIIEILQSMPTLPLWMAFAAALPATMSVVQRYFLITIILSLITWTGLARQVRAKVLAYRTLDYTHAARLAGASHLRIILSHMLPNATSHIIVVAALAVPATILGETALSFLGLGMLPPAVSWGVLLRDAQQLDAVVRNLWLLIPAVPVIVAVTCFQFLGDGLRDAADPYG